MSAEDAKKPKKISAAELLRADAAGAAVWRENTPPDDKMRTPEKIPDKDRNTDPVNPTRFGDWTKKGRCVDF
ncbi:MAG: DUF1674 domain-containing protein [Rhodospirillales bacterium]|nr:DUF1674 domain-containing protein [Rhodospirillales bacterium]